MCSSDLLNNGEVFVPFDETFLNSISNSELSKDVDSQESINITITPVGDCNGVFVKSITNTGFYIKENNKGKSNVSFNWTAIGTKKGYENGVNISDEILAKDFDSNMNDVMFNDSDRNNKAKPIYFDGNKIRFEEAPEGLNKATKSVITPKEQPVKIEVERPKTVVSK